MASYGYTFNSGDGVTPTRLNAARTVSDIVNADIKSDAAIAGTKIAPNFGSQNVVTTGTATAANFRVVGTKTTALINYLGTQTIVTPDVDDWRTSIRIGSASHTAPNVIEFWANNGQRALIDASGNVGIGTSSAASRLHLNNSTAGTAVGLTLSNSNNNWSVQTGSTNNALIFVDNQFAAQRMCINDIGNVGIGTSSPSSALDVRGSSPELRVGQVGASNGVSLAWDNNVGIVNINTTGSAWPIRFLQNGSERMRIDASGNVGIGTSSPSQKLHVAGAGAIINVQDTNDLSTLAAYIQFSDANNNTAGYVGFGGSTDFQVWNSKNTSLWFGTNNTERMRIDASGSLLVGTTAVPTTGNVNGTAIEANYGGDKCSLISAESSNGASYRIVFLNSNGLVGSIITSGSGTAYNTSSDYRLKENETPLARGLSTVSQLNPVSFTWKSDGSTGYGFIAHELQAVVPEAVFGEKDAVDADGRPKYQGVDASKLVPYLVAAVQELSARVEALEAAQ